MNKLLMALKITSFCIIGDIMQNAYNSPAIVFTCAVAMILNAWAIMNEVEKVWKK